MRYTLRDARLIDATTDIAHGDITVDGAQIEIVENAGHSGVTAQRASTGRL